MNLQDAALAGRYARALFQAAQAAKAVDAVRKDLAALARALQTDGSFAAFLAHPRAGAPEKSAAVKKVAGGTPHTLSGRFMALLLSRKRLGLLPAAAAEFQALADRADGLVRAQVRSATVLTEAQVKDLAARLEKPLGGRVALDVVVEPRLLGGVVVRAGDRLWDLSLRGRLERMKEKLLETAAN